MLGPFAPVFKSGDFVPIHIVDWRPLVNTTVFLTYSFPWSQKERVRMRVDRGVRSYEASRHQERGRIQ